MPVSPSQNANMLTQAAKKLECTHSRRRIAKILCRCLARACFIARDVCVLLGARECGENRISVTNVCVCMCVCDVLAMGHIR